ncbi:MAG: response regulator transcription factor [Clostridia bacterium]|nr:response regulator transcription factor [Clostridia bacterium]
MDMKKVLVADDEQAIVRLVSDFLSKNGYEPLAAYDGEEALEVFNSNDDISLIILDIMMPKMDGWEVCRTIRQTSNVPVIMLTARSQEFDELMGFESGADDYVTKPFRPTILMKRVAALLKRDSDFDTRDVYSVDGLTLDSAAHEVRINDKPVTLTLKEYSILVSLVSAPGKVFTRESLLDEIWGYDFDGGMRTVDSHVARLRTKLGDWGANHIKTIYGTGYKIESD